MKNERGKEVEEIKEAKEVKDVKAFRPTCRDRHIAKGPRMPQPYSDG
jgi:hypothetical protein